MDKDWVKDYNKQMALKHGLNNVEEYFNYLEGRNVK